MRDDLSHSVFERASLSMLISVARRHVKHAVMAMGEPYGLNAYQCWMVVLLKEHGPMSLSELAGRMWMDHPTTSRLVHALDDMGLFQVLQDPNHGRRVLICINPDQAAKADEIFAKSMKFRALAVQGLSEEEQGLLKTGLCKMILNLGDIIEDAKVGKSKHVDQELGELVAS